MSDIEQLRQQVTHLLGLLVTAVDERDEARREVCALEQAAGYDTKEQIADERGWDCFMDEADDTSEDQ